MKYLTFNPPPHLTKYVRYYWVLENEVAGGPPYFHRTMADGCAELIFHYRGRFDEIASDNKTDLSFTSGISGPTQRFRRFTIKEDFGIFGVYLYPFALPVLFGIPATEVRDEMPDLTTFLGQRGSDLEEKMMLAPDNFSRATIISTFLTSCLGRWQQREPAVFSIINQIIQVNGLTSISDLAAQSCLSTRQFERTFKEFSGFSPKLFSRIARFHNTMDAYGSKNKTLTEIAYECGYYDQSHFIHDFKAFSGQHPSEYFSGKSESTGYRDV
jgi:AraC-like DNA-binding protein